MSSLSFYCRFCAEQKPSNILIDLRTEITLRDNIMERLGVFREVLVDLEDVALGAHVCGECYSMLENCAEWVSRVKRSQQLLGALCDSKSEVTLKVEVEECEGRGEDGGSWAAYSWSCGHCAAALPSMDALREHSKSAHTTCFGFKCADCDARPLPAFGDFVRHVRAHRHRLRNYCPYCDIKMEDDTHTELHLNEDRCETCGGLEHEDLVEISLTPHSSDIMTIEQTDFQNPKKKKSKLKKNTWSSYPPLCRFCSKEFDSPRMLMKHCIKEHKACFGNRCIECEETQYTYMDFVNHVIQHRPELKAICPFCNQNISENPTHIKDHEDNEYICKLCGKRYKYKRGLAEHRHLTSDGKRTRIKRKRNRHYGPPSLKDLTCDICQRIFANIYILDVHKKIHTDRQKNYICDICGKSFYSAINLEKHRDIHDATAVETCKICNKIVRKYCLKKHVETHLDMKLQCDQCKQYFTSKRGLRQHVIKHLDVKPYECSFCHRTFRHKGVLRVHLRQHTGARPYKCDSCNRDFVNWSNCNSHMKRMHGTTLARCAMTPRGKIALNPATGKPEEILQTPAVQEWSQEVLTKAKKHRPKIQQPQVT